MLMILLIIKLYSVMILATGILLWYYLFYKTTREERKEIGKTSSIILIMICDSILWPITMHTLFRRTKQKSR